MVPEHSSRPLDGASIAWAWRITEFGCLPPRPLGNKRSRQKCLITIARQVHAVAQATVYVSCYVEAQNRDAFMAVKQDLLLAFVDCVERNRAELARRRVAVCCPASHLHLASMNQKCVAKLLAASCPCLSAISSTGSGTYSLLHHDDVSISLPDDMGRLCPLASSSTHVPQRHHPIACIA